MFSPSIFWINDESEPSDIYNPILLGQEGVPVRIRETDRDGLDTVHVNLLLQHDQRQIMTLKDVIKLGGSVPARMDDDPLNSFSCSLINI